MHVKKAHVRCINLSRISIPYFIYTYIFNKINLYLKYGTKLTNLQLYSFSSGYEQWKTLPKFALPCQTISAVFPARRVNLS